MWNHPWLPAFCHGGGKCPTFACTSQLETSPPPLLRGRAVAKRTCTMMWERFAAAIVPRSHLLRLIVEPAKLAVVTANRVHCQESTRDQVLEESETVAGHPPPGRPEPLNPATGKHDSKLPGSAPLSHCYIIMYQRAVCFPFYGLTNVCI